MSCWRLLGTVGFYLFNGNTIWPGRRPRLPPLSPWIYKGVRWQATRTIPRLLSYYYTKYKHTINIFVYICLCTCMPSYLVRFIFVILICVLFYCRCSRALLTCWGQGPALRARAPWCLTREEFAERIVNPNVFKREKQDEASKKYTYRASDFLCSSLIRTGVVCFRFGVLMYFVRAIVLAARRDK